ncbi:ABC transporter ATP-binding protein [Micromonospora sp. RTP1Z1]|uniref:ABC transporter ATP-binding protein n=1 Tax=Micromonospora sp. RTP1Z1 TaxID=2994043 RepID=UPI0029C8A704|nr:ABC transporter ATP-binding protein [Micromonospora sp. RTP1Z1]
MTELTVQAVTKAYGTVDVLRGIDVSVPSGTLTAILGPSGCGKTTLLRMIAGFDRPDTGEIVIGENTVAGGGQWVPPDRRGVGYVAQEGALFPHLDVAANITFGLPRVERRAGHRVAELLELVGLDAGLARRQPHELSGGQQQRVALARALAPRPAVVLLDEPFSSLDAGLRDETRRAVAEALAAAGSTAILVTHDQAEALSLASQVAVMRSGRLAQIGSPSQLYHTPADAAVASFVGEAMVLPSSVRDGVATCALGELPVNPDCADGAAQVVIRPEQVQLVEPHLGGIRATVAEVRFYGHDAAATLTLANGGQITTRLTSTELPAVGNPVTVRVRGTVPAYPQSTVGAAEPVGIEPSAVG